MMDTSVSYPSVHSVVVDTSSVFFPSVHSVDVVDTAAVSSSQAPSSF